MNYFKIWIEYGKKKNLVRTVFTQNNSGISEALDVGQKARRGGRWIKIMPISKQQYLEGISRKYSSNK